MKQDLFLLLVNFKHIIPIVLIAAIVLKLVLYKRSEAVNKNFQNLFYFHPGQIISASAPGKVNLKIVQNALSYYIVFLILFEVFLFV